DRGSGGDGEAHLPRRHQLVRPAALLRGGGRGTRTAPRPAGRSGPGPNSLDALSALESWVEHGIAPEQIVATHRTAMGAVDPAARTRRRTSSAASRAARPRGVRLAAGPRSF